MKKIIFMVALAALVLSAAGMSVANPGDSWILSVSRTQDGNFTAYVNADGNGGTAYEGNFNGGIARVYWDTSNTTMSTDTKLYWVAYYTPNVGNHAWQQIESQFNGTYETYPMDSNIPWEGELGTNHQYAGAYNKTPGVWSFISAGHVPFASQMYLKKGSQLYVKWDYGFAIDNTVGAIQLTEAP